MKKKIAEVEEKTIDDLGQKKITRKQAIKKMGLIAVSAVTMMTLFSSNAQAGPTASAPAPGPPDPGWN